MQARTVVIFPLELNGIPTLLCLSLAIGTKWQEWYPWMGRMMSCKPIWRQVYLLHMVMSTHSPARKAADVETTLTVEWTTTFLWCHRHASSPIRHLRFDGITECYLHTFPVSSLLILPTTWCNWHAMSLDGYATVSYMKMLREKKAHRWYLSRCCKLTRPLMLQISITYAAVFTTLCSIPRLLILQISITYAAYLDYLAYAANLDEFTMYATNARNWPWLIVLLELDCSWLIVTNQSRL